MKEVREAAAAARAIESDDRRASSEYGGGVVHLRKDRPAPVELVKWKPGTDEYELVSGVLVRRTRDHWFLAIDDGLSMLDRASWLLCDADDEADAA
ncbi:hypothetical protein [Agromyces sp. CCNWLW203]|uniref:hypothetical protein n=1 Tax=Agromyces sp. CCNWLW203 TaxID=3112842 RepID=UPI002F96A783